MLDQTYYGLLVEDEPFDGVQKRMRIGHQLIVDR